MTAGVSSSALFAHGVASGDPLSTHVVVWTRVSPPTPDPVPVRWTVATTPGLEDPVAHGETVAGPDRDFTVHVDVGGLEPATTYYYRFDAPGGASPVGRTRTAPAGRTERFRIGVVSCASWPHGYFNAYRRLAEQDVDLVLHLGDYIYENGDAATDIGRSHDPPHRVRTLADYRARHAQYRSDPDLQRLHQRHPVVGVWDDHDLAGNAWRDGAVDHDPEEDGDWEHRRSAAIRAYVEWLPVRLADGAHPDRLYRSFRLGDLADLVVIDSRVVGRERPAGDGDGIAPTIDDPHRSMLGTLQWQWLRERLGSSSGRWRLLANQVMMAPLRALDLPKPLRSLVGRAAAGGMGVNSGQWDGYPGEREALFRLLADQQLSNVVVLSGDLHSSWAGELTPDPKDSDQPVAVEFVAPSITSSSFADTVAPPVPGGPAALRRLIASQNPHFGFFDLEGHGYLIVDITAERLETQFWHVDTVAERADGERLVATVTVPDGHVALDVTAYR